VTAKQRRVEEIERMIVQEDTWKDRQRAEELTKELGLLNNQIKRWAALVKEIQETAGFLEISKDDSVMQKEIERSAAVLKKQLDAFEKELYLSGKYDPGSAIITITAGAGGQDAEDWAAMLDEMYCVYAAEKGWEIATVGESLGDFSSKTGRKPLRHAVLEARGAYAYGLLKKETGVHRLVRISPFSAKHLRHTSFAAVEVLPDITLVDENSVVLKPEDLKIEMTRSSGPGGQNVNKRETAVRIVHLPTGISAESQVERHQARNRDRAMKLLKTKLLHLMERQQAKEIAELRGEKTKIEWANQIRSYVLHPYKLVKDHRSEYESHDPDSVLKGELDGFIEAQLII